jgi:excinuclease ABC subunit C
MLLPKIMDIIITVTKDVFADQKSIICKVAAEAGSFPGIYKMIDNAGKIIYVGKAKNLKKRLLSYCRTDQMSNRILRMISSINQIDFTITQSETEALLLECNFIKQLKPFYNILLKDDKTFPYLVISEHEFPRVFKYRTKKQPSKNFFGPYPAVRSLDEAIKLLQKIFLLRVCSDNYFNNRQRPCLQYFIKRCSGPCCQKVSTEEYAANLQNAIFFLKGKDDIVKKNLQKEMNMYSQNFEYEKAAAIRDRIVAISDIQSKQYIQIGISNSFDVIACAKGSVDSVIQIFFFRNGKNVGAEHFVLQNSSEDDTISDILSVFMLQFYKDVKNPQTMVTSHMIDSSSSVSEAILSFHGILPKIIVGENNIYKRLVQTCLLNAELKLNKKGMNIYKNQLSRLEELVDKKINRIEVYDNSHISGTSAYGCMIVFKDGKFDKGEYRKFSINKTIAGKGDDIGMMSFALSKRFSTDKIKELPELIIIDGGRTQLAAAQEIVNRHNLDGKIKVISVAKQNNRKKGDEKILFSVDNEVFFNKDDELLLFLINLRDEAHRFAITSHRKKRQKDLSKSAIDNIPSIGKMRKKRLLEHFGSVSSLSKASLEDLKTVDGINEHSAKIIFEFFNKG